MDRNNKESETETNYSQEEIEGFSGVAPEAGSPLSLDNQVTNEQPIRPDQSCLPADHDVNNQEWQQYPQPQRVSKMAVASLVMSALGAVGALMSFGILPPFIEEELMMLNTFAVANFGLIFGLVSWGKSKNERARIGIILNEFLMLFVVGMMTYIINDLK